MKLLNQYKTQLNTASSVEQAKQLTIDTATTLWTKTVHQVQVEGSLDDRPLFWGRLKLTKLIKADKSKLNLSNKVKQELIAIAEDYSRGKKDINFDKKSHKRLLLTGFDPFFLDKNIDQSNPSGVTALMLDGKVITLNGVTLQIETAMIPVRYIDFDQGSIEALTRPYLSENSIDMLMTVSMGRTIFQLEHFPGKRRSATVTCNLNEPSGASKVKPIIPLLGNAPIEGPEFIEFSLPYKSMMKVQSPYPVEDNHEVTTLDKKFHPKTLQELQGQIAVRGSGGGYLSNEISYRSVLLAQQLSSKVKIGHLHTPRFKGIDKEVIKKIVTQVEAIIQQSIAAL